ncbi:MAG: Gfo/Idh/MocA family oxidoreductase [Victivallales bacterium]|nr:Gfo/Idh/MocA family oxidoreductase [Victivallales bacterium]
MTTVIADAKAVTALAKSRKLSLTVDHMMTESSFNRKAHELLQAGTLGHVNDCCFHMEFSYGADPAEAATWRCAKPEELGGPIGDVASHCFYMAEFLFGSKIVALAAVYYPKLMSIVAEDGAYIKFKMANGLTGSVKVGFNEPRGGLAGTLTNLGYEIYGDTAVMRGFGTMFQLSGYPDEPIAIRLELDNGKTTEAVSVAGVVNIYQQVMIKHAESVITGHHLTGDDAVHNLELIAAAHRSAKNQGRMETV